MTPRALAKHTTSSVFHPARHQLFLIWAKCKAKTDCLEHDAKVHDRFNPFIIGVVTRLKLLAIQVNEVDKWKNLFEFRKVLVERVVLGIHQEIPPDGLVILAFTPSNRPTHA